MAVTMESAPSPADQLRSAEEELAPVAARMAELRTKMKDAVGRSDYMVASEAKTEIESLEGQWTMATKAVELLRGLISENEKRQRDAELAIQEQRHVDAARAALAAAVPAETAALEELGALVAQARVGVLATRKAIEQALAAEQAAYEARIRVQDARVRLGELPNGQRVPRPNAMSALLESDRVLRAVSGRAF